MWAVGRTHRPLSIWRHTIKRKGLRGEDASLPDLLDLFYVGGDLGEVFDQSQVVLQPGYPGRRVGLHVHHKMFDFMQVDSFQLAEAGLDFNEPSLCTGKSFR